jgi:RNA polymerase sigma-70 factor (ECF subfamily)
MQYEQLVEKAFSDGRLAWPTISFSLRQFTARAAAAGVSPSVFEPQGADLFLAFACADSVPEALRLFEANYLSQIDRYVRRLTTLPHLLDEVRQRVRIKLLVGTAPGIARYAGHGPLMAFVRVTAVRVALDAIAATGLDPSAPAEDLLDSYASFVEDPEIGALKNLYRDRFRSQLEESLAALDSSEKTLLRLHLLDRLSIDAIGAIYRSHRATIARRLVRIREKVLEDFRRRFATRWGISPSDVRSLEHLLGEEIHLSVRRVLATAR